MNVTSPTNAPLLPSPFPASQPALTTRAKDALAAVQCQSDARERFAVADRFLASVANDASATDLERLVASVARESSSKPLATSSVRGAQVVALTALSAGVSGPVGKVLGTLGTQVMSRAYDTEDRVTLGRPWLNALHAHGTPMETLAAQAALEAIQPALALSSRAGAVRATLEMAAGGLQGPPERVVSAIGQEIKKTAYDTEDRRAMGNKVLSVLPVSGGDPLLVSLGATARKASGQTLANSSAAGLHQKAFALIAAPPTSDPDTLFATLGREAMSVGYDTDDCVKMSAGILDGWVAHGKSPVAMAIAEVARTAGRNPMARSSAAGIHRAAFDQVRSGIGSDTLEVALARLGKNAKASAYDTGDAHTLGTAVLDEIGRRTSDTGVKALVDYARRYGGPSVGQGEGVKIQQGILDQIIHANMTLPAPPTNARTPPSKPPTSAPSPAPPSIDERIQQPRVDHSLPADEQMRILEASVAHNTRVRNEAGEQVRAASEALVDLTWKQVECTQRMRALTQVGWPMHTRVYQLERLSVGSLIGGFVGLSVISSGAMLIGGPLSLVSGATFLGLHLAKRAMAKKAAENLREYHLVKQERLSLEAQIKSNTLRVSSGNDLLGQADDAIAKAQSELQLHRMARATNGPAGPTEARITSDAEYVTIHGIKVRKRSEPEAERPAP